MSAIRKCISVFDLAFHCKVLHYIRVWYSFVDYVHYYEFLNLPHVSHFSFSVLTYIFMIDVTLPNTALTSSPRISEFTARILDKLKPLMEADEEIQNHIMEENGVGEQDERTQAIKMMKTSK